MRKTILLSILSLGLSVLGSEVSATDKPSDNKKPAAQKQPSPEVKKQAITSFEKAKKATIDELKDICKNTDSSDLKKICPDLLKCEEAEKPGQKPTKKCSDLFDQEQKIYDQMAATDTKSAPSGSGQKSATSSGSKKQSVSPKPRNRTSQYEEYYVEYAEVYGDDAFYVEEDEEEETGDEEEDNGDEEDEDEDNGEDEEEDNGDEGDDDNGEEE